MIMKKIFTLIAALACFGSVWAQKAIDIMPVDEIFDVITYRYITLANEEADAKAEAEEKAKAIADEKAILDSRIKALNQKYSAAHATIPSFPNHTHTSQMWWSSPPATMVEKVTMVTSASHSTSTARIWH